MTIPAAPHSSSDPSPVAPWHQVPAFSNLARPTLAALARASIRRHHDAGALILSEGEAVDGLFMVESGAIKVSRFASDGREHVMHVIERYRTFNDVAALDGGPNPATAIAQSDAVVWSVARSDLKQLALAYPDLGWALATSIARRTRYLVDQVQDLSMRSVRGRLARLLLRQAEASGSETLPRRLTQEEMASQLGTVREVVSRALRDLSADGIIHYERRSITILDRPRLVEEAQA